MLYFVISHRHGEAMSEKTIRRPVTIPAELWEAAKKKAGTLSVSAVIRRLLEKWVKGDISLD